MQQSQEKYKSVYLRIYIFAGKIILKLIHVKYIFLFAGAITMSWSVAHCNCFLHNAINKK